MTRPKIYFLVGPTAVGKSRVALHLARKLNAAILSLDSMQIYKGMDILTSKPAASTRKRFGHHIIDVVSTTKEYDVSEYRKEALSRIKDVVSKGKTPLFVGGAGLYMSVLVDGIFELDANDKIIREKLYRQLKNHGSKKLYQRLKQVDAPAANKIHPNDAKRIIRALEVFQVTGKPISHWQKQRKGLGDDYQIKIFCLDMQRGLLYEQIDKRVDRMFRLGLVDEVKKLLKLKLSSTAKYAIGIRELKGYFDGLYDLEDAKRLIKRNSRAYAKRQLTWFRKDKRIKWIEVQATDKPQSVASRILKLI